MTDLQEIFINEIIRSAKLTPEEIQIVNYTQQPRLDPRYRWVTKPDGFSSNLINVLKQLVMVSHIKTTGDIRRAIKRNWKMINLNQNRVLVLVLDSDSKINIKKLNETRIKYNQNNNGFKSFSSQIHFLNVIILSTKDADQHVGEFPGYIFEN